MPKVKLERFSVSIHEDVNTWLEHFQNQYKVKTKNALLNRLLADILLSIPLSDRSLVKKRGEQLRPHSSNRELVGSEDSINPVTFKLLKVLSKENGFDSIDDYIINLATSKSN
ncbi:MAG: hypothetical protein ACRCXZ_02515 [Patescibacteria group bacterium]